MKPSPPPAQDDVFLVPDGAGSFYLYAPLRRAVAVVNEAAARVVARYLTDRESPLEAAGAEIIRALEEEGLLGGPAIPPPLFPEGYDFCPHQVTLFLTSRCNLRCRYCYAEAGRKAIDMPREVAQAAIDLVARNAGLLGNSRFGVSFHGGGEPTLAWDNLVWCVEHARETAERAGLDLEISAATNGVLKLAQTQFIAANFTGLNVSLDGPQDIQDHNRPKVGGRGSYDEVRKTLRYLDDVGFGYGLRATITSETVTRMVEIVEQLRDEFKFSYLHMEPIWQCGRCTTTGERPPTDDEFVANYVKAEVRARELGIRLFYSGARLDMITSKFCGAPGDGFSVLPEGVATSCYEVTELDDPRAEVFHYGRYNPNSGNFDFDPQRIAELQKLSVENIPYCQDCFCKWHCAGDCLAKVFQRSGSTVHIGSVRCGMNRALTLASLARLVKGARDEIVSLGPTGG